MTITVEQTMTASFTSGPSMSITFSPSISFAEDDLGIVFVVVESDEEVNIPTGWNLGASALATRSATHLCRVYGFYRIMTSSPPSSISFTCTSSTADARFIVHRVSSTLGWSSGDFWNNESWGSDVSPTYPSPGFPPSYDIGAASATTFDDALIRFAGCNDNGDEGTFDTTQTFSGYTKLSMLTGSEVGAVSLRKDSVSAGTIAALTLDTISVAGGEVDGIAYLNVFLREGGAGGSDLLLRGVG